MSARTQYEMVYYVCMEAEVMQSVATSAYRSLLKSERDDESRDLLKRDCEEVVQVGILEVVRAVDMYGDKLSRANARHKAARAMLAWVKRERERLNNERATDSVHKLEQDSTTTARGEWRGPWDQRDSIEGVQVQIDKGRREKSRKAGGVVAPLPALYATPPSAQSDASARATLARAIASLDEAQRDVIHALHIRGVSQADAARELGLTRAQVRTHERAGLARLGVGSVAGGG